MKTNKTKNKQKQKKQQKNKKNGKKERNSAIAGPKPVYQKRRVFHDTFGTPHIRNQGPQKPIKRVFSTHLTKLRILCPPYWIRHFEFGKCDLIFISAT